MSREKQIEEMAVVLTAGGCKTCVGCSHNNRFQCKPIYEAELLYNADYRKQSEVREECAKEICEEIIKRFDRLLKNEPNGGTTTSAKDFLEFHLPYVINSILKGITEDAGK